MKKIVRKIRQQPEHIRKSILSVSIVVFAIVLFSLWIFSLGATIKSPEAKAKVNQELKPFSILKDNITKGYSGMSNTASNTTN